ncbi:uncharacterized protein BcabD6B2_11830 [Babesia caballi]|uniref:Uncharacterized protein n=1 Tax=Babesia caballi TaxID=5871 RepID=A0AAV4LPB0_BABCB|nr:hypothetical protein BcabD6B2_11830 [Babesia caballi]
MAAHLRKKKRDETAVQLQQLLLDGHVVEDGVEHAERLQNERQVHVHVVEHADLRVAQQRKELEERDHVDVRAPELAAVDEDVGQAGGEDKEREAGLELSVRLHLYHPLGAALVGAL